MARIATDTRRLAELIRATLARHHREVTLYALSDAQVEAGLASYGQSSGDGGPDVFYVINPQESTQGALPASVKASQKRDNVQICRISVPANGDVDALGRVIAAFCEFKYGS